MFFLFVILQVVKSHLAIKSHTAVRFTILETQRHSVCVSLVASHKVIVVQVLAQVFDVSLSCFRSERWIKDVAGCGAQQAWVLLSSTRAEDLQRSEESPPSSGLPQHHLCCLSRSHPHCPGCQCLVKSRT